MQVLRRIQRDGKATAPVTSLRVILSLTCDAQLYPIKPSRVGRAHCKIHHPLLNLEWHFGDDSIADLKCYNCWRVHAYMLEYKGAQFVLCLVCWRSGAGGKHYLKVNGTTPNALTTHYCEHIAGRGTRAKYRSYWNLRIFRGTMPPDPSLSAFFVLNIASSWRERL